MGGGVDGFWGDLVGGSIEMLAESVSVSESMTMVIGGGCFFGLILVDFGFGKMTWISGPNVRRSSFGWSLTYVVVRKS